MGHISPVRAHSLWAGLCLEKLVKLIKLKRNHAIPSDAVINKLRTRYPDPPNSACSFTNAIFIFIHRCLIGQQKVN